MSLSIKSPPTHVQQDLGFTLLPDKPIDLPGEARTRYGAIVETIINALLGLEDIPNSGTHDCVFDAYHRPSSSFVEVKSLRRKNKCPVYAWRIKKDEEAGVPLVYVFGIHDCKGAKSVGDVWRGMADTLDTLLVIPAAVVAKLALAEPLQQIKSTGTTSGVRNGYRRPGYRDGYHNIPWSKLDSGMQDGRRREAEVHGLTFAANVFFHRTLTPWL